MEFKTDWVIKDFKPISPARASTYETKRPRAYSLHNKRNRSRPGQLPHFPIDPREDKSVKSSWKQLRAKTLNSIVLRCQSSSKLDDSSPN